MIPKIIIGLIVCVCVYDLFLIINALKVLTVQ